MSTTTFALLLAVVALCAWLARAASALARLRKRFREAFAQVDAQLRRRHELVPGLVDAASSCLAQEQGVLDALIAARGPAVAGLALAAANPGDAWAMRALGAAEGALGSVLGRLNALLEACPDPAPGPLQQLREELQSIDDRVALARQSFNEAVRNYNAYRRNFPVNVLALQFGHVKDASQLEFSAPRARLAGVAGAAR